MVYESVFPVALVGQVGVTLLLALSIIAAVLGVVAFVWAMVLLWRENNPERTLMRGQGYSFEGDRDDADERSRKNRVLSWVGR